MRLRARDNSVERFEAAVAHRPTVDPEGTPGEPVGHRSTGEVNPEEARGNGRAGSLESLRRDDFHRVDLLERDSWSLFVAGPRVGSWGFADRRTGEFTPWREFIARVRGQSSTDVEVS